MSLASKDMVVEKIDNNTKSHFLPLTVLELMYNDDRIWISSTSIRDYSHRCYSIHSVRWRISVEDQPLFLLIFSCSIVMLFALQDFLFYSVHLQRADLLATVGIKIYVNDIHTKSMVTQLYTCHPKHLSFCVSYHSSISSGWAGHGSAWSAPLAPEDDNWCHN